MISLIPEVARVIPDAISAPIAFRRQPKRPSRAFSSLRFFNSLAAALLVLAAPLARATPTISFTTAAFPATGSPVALATTPAGLNISVNATPTAGSTISQVTVSVSGTVIGSATGSSPFVVNWVPTAAGTYTISATVTDTSPTTTGASASNPTATINSIVTVTTARAVTLVSPAANTTVPLNSQIFLRSTATLSDGVVSKVDFILDPGTTNTLIGTATQSPYNVAYTVTAGVGAHTILARATASNGATVDSATTNFTVSTSVGTNPTVALTAPAASSTIGLGSAITLSATASDADGFIPTTSGGGVTFYVDGDPVGTDLTAPYSVSWTPTVPKVYSLRAQTTDDKGNTVLSVSPYNVTAVTALPTVTVSAAATASVGTAIALSATASPSPGATVTQVEFLENGIVIGTDTTSPYSISWTPSAVGTSSITARVTDSAALVVTSSAVNVTVSAAVPTVTLTGPAATPINTVATLSATATPGTGAMITQVQFLSGTTVLGTDTTAPYSFDWTPTTAGTVSLTARVTDSNGATTSSSAMSVTVAAAAAPTVSITAPVTGAIAGVGSNVTVTAAATPGVGATVAQVQFLVGTTIIGTVSSAPYSVIWVPTSAGNFSLTARVLDSNNTTANSPAVTVTAVTPTSVSITAPANNATVAAGSTVSITANPTPTTGATITQIAFFANGVSLGAPVTAAPYTLAWTPTTSGLVLLTARATDSFGTVVTSPALTIAVADTVAPAIALTLSPGTAPATTLPTGGTRYALATVTPAAGRAIVRVEFFVDGTKVGEKTSAPYVYKFTAPSTPGTYAFVARATDNAGLTRDAALSLTVVTAVGTPPTVNLISPANGATAVPGTAVSLAATASAPGGSITGVQFYANGLAVGNLAATSPYTGSFTPSAPGPYVIEAVATDERGNTSVSNPVTITAAFTNPTVALTAPLGTAVAPTRATPGVPLNLTATATGGSGASVLLVEFFVGGNLVGSRTSPTAVNGTSYTFAWTPSTAQLGLSNVTARVTDTNSLTTTSNATYVNVVSVTTPPPVVNNVAVNPVPALGLQTLSTVNFVATVAPGNPSFTVASVEFFLTDGVNAMSVGTGVRETTTSNLYRLVYNLGTFDFSAITPNAAGAFPLQLFVIARDNTGVQTQSGLVNLAVNPSSSAPPTIQTFVNGGTTIAQGNTLQLAGIGADPDGVVVSMQLYANGVVSGGAQLNPQGGIAIFNFTPAVAGAYRLFVVVTDDTGNTTLSSITNVTVTATVAPVVAFVRPADDTAVTTVGAPTYLEATVTLVDQTIVPTVQFTVTGAGGRILPAITATRVSPTSTTYRGIFSNAIADTYRIGLTASVGGGTVITTSPTIRTVQLINAFGNLPFVGLTNFPGTATTASTISLLATATDGDGYIASVEFFLNRVSLGFGIREQLTNLWRLPASFAGLTAANYEVQALARDNAGNTVATAINTLALTTASSSAPTVTITATPATVAFGRSVTLNATPQDSDGTITSVAYFNNGVQIGTGGGAPTWSFTFTPAPSGAYNLHALVTDSSGNTALSAVRVVTVRPNNPLLDDDAFITQTFADLSNNAPNAVQLAALDVQLAAGTLTRAQLTANLATNNGAFNNANFNNTANALIAYWLLMGEWPTTANYNTIFGQRGNLATVVNTILTSPEYALKFSGTLAPTAGNFNAGYATTFTDFANRLWQAAGLGSPSTLDLFRFQNNDTASLILGRGYAAAGVATATAEFITRTNSGNTALINLGRTAALYYQLDRPTVLTPQEAAATPNTVSTPAQVATRIAALNRLPDLAAVADATLKDLLYAYRYVTITQQPQSLTVAARSGAIFSVEALGAPPISYQWLQNGAPIATATSPTLYLTNIANSQAGNYSVVVTTGAGSTTSEPALLTLSAAPTRLGNISSRGFAGNGANVLTAGFVVTGTGTKQMLIRVIGPALGPLGIAGFLPNPNLTVINSAGVATLTNDNWGTQTGGAAAVTAIQQATSRVGAFALPNNSLDAVVLATLTPGSYTVQASGAGNSTGVAIIEVYDASTTLAGPKAVNVSTRANVGTGENILIAGFVVNGTVSRRVLIRGVGPTLRNFGLNPNAVLADPQLKLVDSAAKTIATNDDWASGDSAPFIAAAAASAGAFPLANGSKDSSILVMLAPGAYTAQLSGVGATNNTGIALIEVYDVDP